MALTSLEPQQNGLTTEKEAQEFLPSWVFATTANPRFSGMSLVEAIRRLAGKGGDQMDEGSDTAADGRATDVEVRNISAGKD